MKVSRLFVAVVAAIGVCVPMAAAAAGAESPKAPVPAPPSGARVSADSVGTNKVDAIAKANSALGHYYDDDAKQYVVMLPAESKATAAAFQSAGAATRVVRSEFTTQQVTTADASIKQHTWHPAAKKYNYVFYFDPRRDAISLATTAPETVVAPLEKANPGLIYYHHETNVGRDFNRQDDPPPHWGGSLITQFVNGPPCSAGFTAQDGVGNRYMVTAGHCFANGTQLLSGMGTYSFGTFANPSYPFDDLGVIAGSTYQGYVYGGNQLSGNARQVFGGGTAVINGFSNYCRSGVTTGEQCGNRVISEAGTVCTAGVCTSSQYVYRGNGVPSAGGDSGAPLYSVSTDNRGVFVIGIHTGRGGADMLAEPYSSLVAAYGLTAVTSPF